MSYILNSLKQEGVAATYIQGIKYVLDNLKLQKRILQGYRDFFTSSECELCL